MRYTIAFYRKRARRPYHVAGPFDGDDAGFDWKSMQFVKVAPESAVWLAEAARPANYRNGDRAEVRVVVSTWERWSSRRSSRRTRRVDWVTRVVVDVSTLKYLRTIEEPPPARPTAR